LSTVSARAQSHAGPQEFLRAARFAVDLTKADVETFFFRNIARPSGTPLLRAYCLASPQT
jgi:hypothetical protein